MSRLACAATSRCSSLRGLLLGAHRAATASSGRSSRFRYNRSSVAQGGGVSLQSAEFTCKETMSMRIREMELLTTHHTQQTARTPPSRFTPLVSEPPLCRRGRRQTAADTTYCSCISMPKRSFTDLDNDIILEPAQTNDVPHATAMLYADILLTHNRPWSS